MASRRIRTLLTHIAAAVLGALVGITPTQRVEAWFRHGRAEIAVVIADQAYNAGNEDKAILVLSQATAKDPCYYEPFNYLGRIYSHKGNQALALEMYQKALGL
jgi:Tfp pilus assembly protein PilF